MVYTYNNYGSVATKIDAKGQMAVYSYDSYQRLSQIQRYTGAIQPIRVKAGATAPFVDTTFGKLWAADYGYVGGSIYTGSASLDTMIRTQRTATGTLEYRFNVPNTSYSVYLWFAEIAGAQVNYRRFYIKVSGVNYGEFDIALLASGQNKLYITGPSLTVTNGQIDIQLVPITGNPMLAAIEIVQTAGTVEDTCQRTNFYYDVNPFDGTFPQYATARPTAKVWSGCQAPYQFVEMHSYTSGGLVSKKRLRTQNAASQTFQLDTSQTYDNEGKVLTVKYPDTPGVTGLTYTYTYDGLGRPNKLTDNYNVSGRDWVSNVQYGPRDELTQISYYQGPTETRTYNNLGQLRWIHGSMEVEYVYSATQNNGQITQMRITGGEEVTYTYDSLNRLIGAVTTGPEWGQSFTYDGFGNRTGATVTKGSAPSSSILFDPATNRAQGFSYDANGNMTYVCRTRRWLTTSRTA